MTNKIALIEPFVAKEDIAQKAFPETSEPVHLIGMHNLLANYGIEVQIIDAYSNQISEWDLTQRLEMDGFTHIGFTTYDYGPSLTYVKRVINNLSSQILIIVGGWGATYTPARMAGILHPDLIIRGDGELALIGLAKNGFNPQRLPTEFSLSELGRTLVIDSLPISLDKIPYHRPYSLEDYSYEACPRLQRGCSGHCVFCSGAYQNTLDYRSPIETVELLKYLKEAKNANVISPNVPDFTASSTKANAIIYKILEAGLDFKEYRFEVRIDTLATCVEKEPELWKELCRRSHVHFESAIDSFSLTRLRRLGKNVNQKFIANIFNHLENIVSIGDCTITLSRIALDPFITIDEFLLDNEQFRKVLETFPGQITIGVDIMNQLRPVWGTPSMEAGIKDNPWAEENLFTDPIIAELKRILLDVSRFKKWCQLASQMPDYVERNEVFVEILRVTNEHASSLIPSPKASVNISPK